MTVGEQGEDLSLRSISEQQREQRALEEGGEKFEFVKQVGFRDHRLRGLVHTKLGTDKTRGYVGFRFDGNGEVELGPAGVALYVDEKVRNRGLGTAISRVATDYIQDVAHRHGIPLSSIYLYVYKGNEYARRCAEAAGFTIDTETSQLPHNSDIYRLLITN